MSKRPKPVWYRYSVKNIVESDGPPRPPETMNACVKDWNAWMICSTRLKKMIGLSSGSVIRKNFVIFPAPSMEAAS